MHELGTLVRQTWLVFGRSLRAGLREPALAFVFPLAFPLLIIGLFSQVYSRVADLPGFPAGSYLGWMTPAVVLMAAMFGAGHSALGLVRDLQTGFLDRLRLLPIRPAALMLGRLGFDMARVTAAGLGVLAVAVALGAPLRGGRCRAPRPPTPTATWWTASAPPWPGRWMQASSSPGWPRWPPPSPSPNWRPPGASPASSTATDPTVAGLMP
jgi:hypothetical protein